MIPKGTIVACAIGFVIGLLINIPSSQHQEPQPTKDPAIEMSKMLDNLDRRICETRVAEVQDAIVHGRAELDTRHRDTGTGELWLAEDDVGMALHFRDGVLHRVPIASLPETAKLVAERDRIKRQLANMLVAWIAVTLTPP